MQYPQNEPAGHAKSALPGAIFQSIATGGALVKAGSPAITGAAEPVSNQDNAWRRLKNCVISMADIEISHGATFLFVPVFLSLGASIWFALDNTPSVMAIYVAFALALLLSLAVRYRQTLFSFFVRAFLLVVAGMLLADIETARHATIMLDTPVTTVVTGKVERRERDGRGYWRYVISLGKTENPVVARPPQRVALLARSRHAEIQAGDYITGRARLSPPSGPALPGLNDFAMASYFAGIGATGYFYGAPSPAPKDAVRDSGDDGWISVADAFLYKLRSAIAERIRSIVPGDAGAFSASIITDERRAISADVVEALRVSGLAHIVAISGLNMALAGGIFFVGLRMILNFVPAFSKTVPVKKVAAFAALLMVTAYYLVSGFAVSAERAWLMMSIMLIAVLVDRPSISMRNVALSAIVIIAMTPSEVTGPSFRMSFAATIALVAIYGIWSGRGESRLEMKRKPLWLSAMSILRGFVVGVTVTSLIGGVSTAIYSVEHFHRLSGFGLFANLAAMPVMSFIVMPAALVGMLLMPFGLDAPFISIMGYGLDIVISIAFEVASWGGDSVVGRQHAWFVGIASIGFLLLTLLRTHLRLAGLVPLVMALALSIHEARRPVADILVDGDGQMVALPKADAVATNRIRPSSFIYDQWRSALLLPEKHVAPVMISTLPAEASERDANGRRPIPDRMARETSRNALLDALKDETGRFACEKKTWCLARISTGVTIATVENPAWISTACDTAGIVIASRRAGFATCRSGAVLLDMDTLRKTGALEISIMGEGENPGLSITAANAGSQRDWTIHRAYNWRSRSFDFTLPEPVQKLLAAR